MYDYELFAKLEFEVSVSDKQKINDLKDSLTKSNGIKDVEVREDLNRIYVKTSLPTAIVHEKIENLTGNLAVLRGMGSGISNSVENLDAAVCELSNDEHLSLNIKGVIRFVQLDEQRCAIDGIVDGLTPGEHAFNICEYGDLSNGCKK